MMSTVSYTAFPSTVKVKAWCYYESRMLGAHHGLLSTYGLETLVLYIFNVHHRHISNPLEVRAVAAWAALLNSCPGIRARATSRLSLFRLSRLEEHTSH